MIIPTEVQVEEVLAAARKLALSTKECPILEFVDPERSESKMVAILTQLARIRGSVAFEGRGQVFAHDKTGNAVPFTPDPPTAYRTKLFDMFCRTAGVCAIAGFVFEKQGNTIAKLFIERLDHKSKAVIEPSDLRSNTLDRVVEISGMNQLMTFGAVNDVRFRPLCASSLSLLALITKLAAEDGVSFEKLSAYVIGKAQEAGVLVE